MGEPLIDSTVRAGDLGELIAQHGRLYRAEYGLDERFEAYVASGVSDAVLSGTATRFWLVRDGDRLLGSAAVSQVDEGVGQFRWFLLEPELRGRGVGRLLLAESLEHCRRVGDRQVFLWTIDVLRAAAALYRSFGFIETQRLPESAAWGVPTTAVRYDLSLRAGSGRG
jgi:GNAT superfamily N-acetyltransferase